MASRIVFGPQLLALGAAVVCVASPVHAAETATLERASPLLSSPRSSGRTLSELPAGSKVRVLERKGNWIVVIARGEKGWLSSEALTPAPDTLDKGTEVTTNTAATLRAKPDGRGKALFDVQRGERFRVVEDRGEWISVVDETETSGWLPRESLDSARPKKVARKAANTAAERTNEPKSNKRTWSKQGLMDDEGGDNAPSPKAAEKPSREKVALQKAPVAKKKAVSESDDEVDMTFDVEDTAPSARATSDDDENPLDGSGRRAQAGNDSDEEPQLTRGRTPTGRSRFVWGVGAQLGMVAQSSTFSSEGSGFRSNYALSNGSGAVSMRLSGHTRVGTWALGAELGGYMSFAGGNMAHRDVSDDTMEESIAFSQAGIGGTVTADYNPSKTWYVGGLGGVHRVRRTVTVDDNLALPSEAQTGFHLGARAGYVAPAGTWGVEASGASVLGGSLVQREGLRDGTSSKVGGMRLGASATYRITPRFQGEVGYQLVTSSIDFSGASQRDPENDAGAHRSDTTQLLGVGARFAF